MRRMLVASVSILATALVVVACSGDDESTPFTTAAGVTTGGGGGDGGDGGVGATGGTTSTGVAGQGGTAAGGGGAGQGGDGGGGAGGGTAGAGGASGGAGGGNCPVWYHDADGDGYGDPNDSLVSCTQPVDYVDNSDDCDDDDDAVYLGAPEICDGKDNDCNLTADDGVAVTFDATNYATIQEGLDAAEVAGGGTVYVCAGTYEENLSIAADITLLGVAGPSMTFVEPASGQTNTRVVTTDPGLTVTLQGLTLSGVDTSDDGGAVLASENGATSVVDCVITANQASRGGGIFMEDGQLEVVDSTLDWNVATSDGGAIFAAGGSVTIDEVGAETTFEANQAANGGAIAMVRSNTAASCDLSISGATLTANSAGTRGGAVYLEGTTPSGNATLTATLVDTMLGGGSAGEGNDANEGGALAAVTSAAIAMDDATALSHNHASVAGGGMVLVGEIEVVGQTAPPSAPSVDHNVSDGHAGGISVDGLCTLTNLTVASNQAGGQGGGLRITLPAGTMYVTAVRIEDNQAGTEVSGEGGGITFTTGSVRLDGCELWDNRGVTGGGMVLQADSSVLVLGGSVLRNGWDLDPDDLGGGAWIKSGQGALDVVSTDWGTAADDNRPFDVYTVAGSTHEYTGYGAAASFSCDNQGCN